MIIDKLENAHLYKGLSARIARGLELLEDPALAKKQDGKYEIDGDKIFVLIQRYVSKNKSEMLFEAHKNYIDIQAILEGAETIGYAPADELEVTIPYKPDVMKCADPEVFTEAKLSAGMFGIFFPNDAHKPCYDYKGKANVVKAVVKIKID
jgi:YhcH/YjgK/YiaL family protein